MTAGVSIESWSSTAAFSGSGFDANYPVTNLSDVVRSSNIARVSGGATTAITAALGAAHPVSCVGLIHHNLQVGDTVRVQAGAYDSGTVAVWPAGAPAGYRCHRPFVFPEVSASSVTVTITAAGDLELGAIEIARFWEWPGISPGAQVGLTAVAADLDYVGGGAGLIGAERVRTYSGQIDKIQMTLAATRGLDLQGFKGKSQPLLFVEDLADPASWARRCFLARQNELPAAVGAVYRHDAYQIRLVEWLR